MRISFLKVHLTGLFRVTGLKYISKKESIMLKDIAVIGMAVMGKNLALNIADHGFSTLIYNRTTEVMEAVLKENKHKLN